MPNTYDSYVLGWNSHFWQKKWVAQPNTYEWLWLSKSYRYWSSSLWKCVSSLRTTRPMAIRPRTTRPTAISSEDNSTHGNFVQGQLDPRNFVQGQFDPRQFRPRTTRPTAISSKDNSTQGNFVQGQLDQRQFRPYSIVAVSTRISWRSSIPLVGVTWDEISSKYNRVCLYKDKLKVTPRAVTWDNSTQCNFVQIQSCLFLQNKLKVIPPGAVTWDNSTKSNFAQIQLCPFPLYIYLN